MSYSALSAISSPISPPRDSRSPPRTGEKREEQKKKSFCIESLLARNEKRNLIESELSLRDIRCNNELARLFRNKSTMNSVQNHFFDNECSLDGEPAPKNEDSDMDRVRDCENSRSLTPFSSKSNETHTHSDLSSPPISPGNENEFENEKIGEKEDRQSQIQPRPGLLMNTSSQSLMNPNQSFMIGSRPGLSGLAPHPAFLAYSTPHPLSSAFHPLSHNGAPNTGKMSMSGTKMSMNNNPPPSGLGMGGSNNQHLHHMQLEWLARTGMLYPRLPELAGKCLIALIRILYLPLGCLLNKWCYSCSQLS